MTEPTHGAPPANSGESTCTVPLQQLALGDFSAWRGLTGQCSSDGIAAALGPSQGDTDRYGTPGGNPTRYRIYPNTSASKNGIYVWFVDDQAVALQMQSVSPVSSIQEQLGEPEAKELSRMPGFKTQWIYASRGLTLHIDDTTGAIAWLYAYRPMNLDEYRASWLSRVEILRHRVE